MYSKTVPFKDFNGKPRTQVVNFNLTEREVFKLLVELKMLMDWRESLGGPERELPTAEVVAFYNALEDILLTAWGEPSQDGLHFRKGGKYEFEESALFAACMVEFVSDPKAAMELLDGIMPTGMEDIVKKQDASMAELAKTSDDEDLKAEVAKLRAQLAANPEQKSPEA